MGHRGIRICGTAHNLAIPLLVFVSLPLPVPSAAVAAQAASAGCRSSWARQFAAFDPTALATAPPWCGVSRGFFYKPPEDGTNVEDLARSHALIVLGLGDEDYRDNLRQAGYGGLILKYLLTYELDGPSPPPADCDRGYVPGRNTAAVSGADFCDLPEDAFLHNGEGQRLMSVYQEDALTRHLYHMNPAHPGWQRLWLDRVLEQVGSPGFDGVFLDNLGISSYSLRNQETNSDGTLTEYPDNDSWREAVRGFLERMRLEVSSPVWANMISTRNDGGDWDLFLPYLDGVMSEGFGAGYPPRYLKPDWWEGQQVQAEKALAMGKGYLAVSQGEHDELERMRYSLSSFWLIAQPGAYFRYGRSSAYRAVWNYPELEVDLGDPLGPRYHDGETGWRRDFACGHVRVDPGSGGYEFAPDSALPTCPG